MGIQSLIDTLKEKHGIQKSYWKDDLIDSIEKFDLNCVAEGLDVDKHRWYETSIIVFEVVIGLKRYFIGVRACTDLFSESSSWEDIFWQYNFFEMEEKRTITYIEKK
jgi:hypothetical protein